MFRIKNFIKDIVKGAVKVIKKTFIDIFNNVESVIVLGAASIGATAIISELPFMIATPMWIESTMVIPVASIILVLGLVSLAVWRHEKGLVINYQGI